MILDELGSRHIDTARAQFQLGSALWLSNKPLETYQAVKLFDSAIRSMTQYEPNNQILTATKTIRDEALEALEKFETMDTLSAWPYWRPPTARTRLLDGHRGRHAWRLWVSGPSNGW